MKRFIKKYYIELLLLAVALIGLLLLFGNFSFQKDLMESLRQIATGAIQTVRSSLRGMSGKFASVSGPEFLLILMIISAVSLVFYRMRIRYKTDPDNIAEECPRCGNPIKRIHRSAFDRLIGATIKPNSRRYACTNPYCGWRGLRRYMFRHESAPPIEHEH